MQHFARHVLSGLAAAALAVALAHGALAESQFPSKPVHLVVPFPPGATSDNIGRVVSQKLSDILGQPVVVDNRPGAGGTLGAALVAKADADGYTLLMGTNGMVAVAPHLIQVSYDPVADFAPVSLIGEGYSVLAVNPALPAKTVAELVALAKQKPGEIHFGSAGNGSVTHIMGEVFKAAAGVDLVHVPYKGSAASMNDLLSGQIEAAFDPAAKPLILAGKLRALAVTTASRWPELPEVPTMAEAGIKEYRARLTFAVSAPARTPAAVIETLNKAMVKALADPDAVSRLAGLGIRAQGSTPDEMRQSFAEDSALYGEIIRKAGIKAE